MDSSLLPFPPLPRARWWFAGAQQQQQQQKAARAAVGIPAAAKMNDADVAKQIQQMVRFIRQEAEEKASEISVSAEEVSTYPSPRLASPPRVEASGSLSIRASEAFHPPDLPGAPP